MNKGGRPRKPEAREMVVGFRLTLPEYRRLQALAMRRGLGVGELARDLVLGGLDGQAKPSASGDGPGAAAGT